MNVEQISDNIYVADDGIELSKFLEIMDAFVNKDPNHTGARDTVGVTAPSLTQGVFFSGYDFYTGVNDVNGRAEQYYVTVSYTHLDVYKRQVCISTGLPEGHKLNQTEDCQMSDFDNRDEEEKKETGLEENKGKEPSDKKEEKTDKPEKEYEDVCFICRRPESKAGKMYHLPNNILSLIHI